MLRIPVVKPPFCSDPVVRVEVPPFAPKEISPVLEFVSVMAPPKVLVPA